ncbi:MAG: CvpA family protein [Thermodesulfobacteriota bacterium]
MNWLDFTLIGVIATGTLFGIITGPLWQIYRISSVAISVAAAFLLHNLTGSIFSGIFSPEISDALGYAITFGVILVTTYAVGNLFRKFLTKRKFGFSGRLIGGSISFTKTVLTCCIIIAGVSFWGNEQTGETIGNSLVAKNIEKVTKKVISRVPQDVKDMSIVEKKISDEKQN